MSVASDRILAANRARNARRLALAAPRPRVPFDDIKSIEDRVADRNIARVLANRGAATASPAIPLAERLARPQIDRINRARGIDPVAEQESQDFADLVARVDAEKPLDIGLDIPTGNELVPEIFDASMTPQERLAAFRNRNAAVLNVPQSERLAGPLDALSDEEIETALQNDPAAQAELAAIDAADEAAVANFARGSFSSPVESDNLLTSLPASAFLPPAPTPNFFAGVGNAGSPLGQPVTFL